MVDEPFAGGAVAGSGVAVYCVAGGGGGAVLGWGVAFWRSTYHHEST